MKELKVGAKAPKFELLDKDGETVKSAWSKSDFSVLFFYPKDSTPGCTIEANEFSDALKSFQKRNVSVVGISGGDQKSKAKFCAKHSLEVCLVSDTDFEVSQAYGVYGEKKFMGRTFNGIHRKTFIVDTRGVVVHVFSPVKPEGHAEEVLRVIDGLRGGRAKDNTQPSDRRASSSAKGPRSGKKLRGR
jgi:peroxiredoxin Q/BCP